MKSKLYHKNLIKNNISLRNNLIIILDDRIGRIFLKDEDVGKIKRFKIVSVGDEMENGLNVEILIE